MLRNNISPQMNRQAVKDDSKKPTFQKIIRTDNVQKNIQETLGDAVRTQQFTANLISTVNQNPGLRDCDAISVIVAALNGTVLGLSPFPSLGQFYMVPYENTVKTDQVDQNGEPITKKIKVATFQMGYRGYIQLALRSGDYLKVNVAALKEGEVISWDPITEELKYKLIEDDEEREAAPTAGYYAFFTLRNGFTKKLYWTKKKMLMHADRFSPAFSMNGEKSKRYKDSWYRVPYEEFEKNRDKLSYQKAYSSFWYKDFDTMAYKTMLRQLISKWGPMSVDMQRAYMMDDTFKNDLSEETAPVYINSDSVPLTNEGPADQIGYDSKPAETDMNAVQEQSQSRPKATTKVKPQNVSPEQEAPLPPEPPADDDWYGGESLF